MQLLTFPQGSTLAKGPEETMALWKEWKSSETFGFSLGDDKTPQTGREFRVKNACFWELTLIALPSSLLTKTDVCSQVNIQGQYTFLSANLIWHFNTSK